MKETLHRYLRNSRQAVLWKLEGLSEREARMPLTPTGTNVLGMVKHLAYVEAGYLGDTFGRPVPSFQSWSLLDDDVDPHLDLYATAHESPSDIRALYERICAHADETITSLPLDAPGRVPWWRPKTQDVTLHTILVHVLAETARHAGHVDIVRELTDGAAGLRPESTNMPEDDYDWPAYVLRLKAIAESF